MTATQCTEGFRVTARIPGRAAYVGRTGELYVARRYAVYRSVDWGATWQLDCYVPDRGWKALVARSGLGARLLRYSIMAFQVLDDGSRIAVAHDGVYRAAPGETRMSRTFRIVRGSRPLHIAVDGCRVLFGEYGADLARHAVCIYASHDGGKTFDAAYTLPQGDVRHIHSVITDPYDKGYWVLAGDYGQQPGIGLLSHDYSTLEWLVRGGQYARAAHAIVERDCLLFGTDSDYERNFILRLDKQSGRTDVLAELEGSSLYAAAFGPLRVVSTCVEPNPACPSRECSLHVSPNGADWNRVAVHRKDRHSPYFFEYGTLVLPNSTYEGSRGMCSGQSVEGAHNEVHLFEYV